MDQGAGNLVETHRGAGAVIAACREPVDGKGLCPACWSKLSFITRPYCERLGIPFVYDPGPGILSMEAIADPHSGGRARSSAVRNTARAAAAARLTREGNAMAPKSDMPQRYRSAMLLSSPQS
jgi:predicted amidophosphoribosyltransferase